MSFGIDRRARSRKGKGWFRRAPEPREVGERLGWLLRRSEKLGLRKSGWAKDTWTAEVEFDELAPPARFALDASGELHVKARTFALGPGYHKHVLRRLAPILDEIEYEWIAEGEAVLDPAAGMCEWLAGELAQDGDGMQLRIGMPDGRVFVSEAPLLTPLGPRDAAWCAAAIADPSKCADVFPWWDDKPGRRDLARALIKMWQEVAWREPIDKAEQALLEAIDDDLRAARKADPDAPIPYADWAELLANANADGERIEQLRARAGRAQGTIGYRRLDMVVELSGGWFVQLPGAFVGHWEDEGERFWATDGARAVEFTSFTADPGPTSHELLELAPPRYEVVERFADGDRVGRAEAHDEDLVHVVHGLMTCAPHVAVLTCKSFKQDQPWALATWRSLEQRPESEEPAE